MTIDTHHHILPDFFWQATENADAPIGGLPPLRWSKEVSISFMDDAGIDLAVVSLSTPGVHTGDNLKARAWARRCNEFSAELVQSRPDRFGGFACLPLPDVDASLEELSYALDVLRWMALFSLRIPMAYTSEIASSSRFSKNWSAARRSSMWIPILRRTRSRIRWDCPTTCSTSRRIPIAPPLRCTTRTDSRARQT